MEKITATASPSLIVFFTSATFYFASRYNNS